MDKALNNTPSLMLGTAMWGWTIPKEQCFEILDTFYEQGYRTVDAATNYPINKKSVDFRLSENILQEWFRVNGISDLRVIMKIGSINNRRSPDHNLTYSFMVMCLDEYLFKLESNLDTLMIHWDNRDDASAIQQSFEALQLANKKGIKVGLSGIRHPEIHAQVNKDYDLDFCIQIKHNLLHSDYQRYTKFHGKPRFITYGINAGGLKLDTEQYRQNSSLKTRGGNIEVLPPIVEQLKTILRDFNQSTPTKPINKFNQCGMIYAFHSPDIMGILMGSSSKEQLLQSIEFYRQLEQGQYLDFYPKLQQLAATHAK